jgi:hypothetical protein
VSAIESAIKGCEYDAVSVDYERVIVCKHARVLVVDDENEYNAFKLIIMSHRYFYQEEVVEHYDNNNSLFTKIINRKNLTRKL